MSVATKRPRQVRQHLSSGASPRQRLGGVVTEDQSIRIPVRRGPQEDCGSRSPANNFVCNRPAGHGGRHLFAWRHVDGRVREVWG